MAAKFRTLRNLYSYSTSNKYGVTIESIRFWKDQASCSGLKWFFHRYHSEVLMNRRRGFRHNDEFIRLGPKNERIHFFFRRLSPISANSIQLGTTRWKVRWILQCIDIISAMWYSSRVGDKKPFERKYSILFHINEKGAFEIHGCRMPRKHDYCDNYYYTPYNNYHDICEKLTFLWFGLRKHENEYLMSVSTSCMIFIISIPQEGWALSDKGCFFDMLTIHLMNVRSHLVEKTTIRGVSLKPGI